MEQQPKLEGHVTGGGGAVEGVAALPKVGERKEMNGKGWVKCYVRKS